jgi:hypothetical protein
LTGLDEEGTHVQLREHLSSLVNPKIAEHRGRVVKNTGDGLLAEFNSAVDAVRCAVDIQRRIASDSRQILRARSYADAIARSEAGTNPLGKYGFNFINAKTKLPFAVPRTGRSWAVRAGFPRVRSGDGGESGRRSANKQACRRRCSRRTKASGKTC